MSYFDQLCRQAGCAEISGSDVHLESNTSVSHPVNGLDVLENAFADKTNKAVSHEAEKSHSALLEICGEMLALVKQFKVDVGPVVQVIEQNLLNDPCNYWHGTTMSRAYAKLRPRLEAFLSKDKEVTPSGKVNDKLVELGRDLDGGFKTMCAAKLDDAERLVKATAKKEKSYELQQPIVDDGDPSPLPFSPEHEGENSGIYALTGLQAFFIYLFVFWYTLIQSSFNVMMWQVFLGLLVMVILHQGLWNWWLSMAMPSAAAGMVTHSTHVNNLGLGNDLGSKINTWATWCCNHVFFGTMAAMLVWTVLQWSSLGIMGWASDREFHDLAGFSKVMAKACELGFFILPFWFVLTHMGAGKAKFEGKDKALLATIITVIFIFSDDFKKVEGLVRWSDFLVLVMSWAISWIITITTVLLGLAAVNSLAQDMSASFRKMSLLAMQKGNYELANFFNELANVRYGVVRKSLAWLTQWFAFKKGRPEPLSELIDWTFRSTSNMLAFQRNLAIWAVAVLTFGYGLAGVMLGLAGAGEHYLNNTTASRAPAMVQFQGSKMALCPMGGPCEMVRFNSHLLRRHFDRLNGDGAWRLEIQAKVKEIVERNGYKVDPELVMWLIWAESDFNPAAISHAGAQGLMQLMPATANYLGVADSFDADQNLEGGIKHLEYLLERYHGDPRLALAAYNSGENNVDKYGGVPPFDETQRYVERIMGAYTE